MSTGMRLGFIESFVERTKSKRTTILCGDINRDLCDQIAIFLRDKGVDAGVHEVIRAEHRDRVINTVFNAMRHPVTGKILTYVFILQPLLYILLKAIQVRASRDVLEDISRSDSVIWIGLAEDFDVAVLVDSRFHRAMRDKHMLWLSYPRRETAEKLGLSYTKYFENYINALNTPWEEMREISEKLRKQLSRGRVLRVRSQRGTDFTLRYDPSTIHAWYGVISEKALGKGILKLLLPAGEISISSSKRQLDLNGRIYFDTPNILYDEVISGIEIVVENGRVVEYRADKGEKALDKYFSHRDAKRIYELGLGLNPAIKPCGSMYLDEKAHRTLHIGFGRPWTPLHLDLVMSNPVVYVDGCELAWDN